MMRFFNKAKNEMIKNIIILSILIFTVQSVYCKSQNDSNVVSIKTGENSKEDFTSFIQKFCTDSLFQLSRINFPFLDYQIDEKNNRDTIVDTIQILEWNFLELMFSEKYVIQTYDNFNMTLRDTNERVIAYEGVENDISILYYFKRKEGKWKLTCRMNYSE